MRLRYDEPAERSVLSTVLQRPEKAYPLVGRIEPRDFWSAINGLVMGAVFYLNSQAREVTAPAVVDWIYERQRGIKDMGRAELHEYLQSTVNMVSPVDDVLEVAKVLRRMAQARRVIEAAQEILRRGTADDVPDDDLIGDAMGLVAAATEEDTGEDAVPVEVALEQLQAEAEASKLRGPTDPPGLLTGIARFDEVSGGLMNGELVTVAGSTGKGKTALALTIALNAMVNPDKGPILFVSKEMVVRENAQRLLAMLSRVDHEAIRSANWRPMSDAQLQDTSLAVMQAKAFARKLWFYTRRDMSVEGVMAYAQRMKREIGLAGVFIDYLQLMESSVQSRRNESREQEVARISRYLKTMAIALDVPVIDLSQLNRASEAKDEPELRDLRESGAIEQDSNKVLILWGKKPEPGAPTPSEEVVDLFLLKNRSGRTGRIPVLFRKNIVLIEDVPQPKRDEHDAPIPLD